MAVLNNLSDQIQTSGGSVPGGTLPVVLYIYTNDTDATVTAAGYLVNAATGVNQAPGFNFGSSTVTSNIVALVYTVDMGANWYRFSVTGQNATYQVGLIANVATGDVVGPAVSTNRALVRFSGATGKIIQNGIILESDTGELQLVNGIQNAVGAVGAPTYTFSGRTTNGMWSSAANTVDFSTNAFRSLQLAPSPALSVNYSVITASATGNPVIWAPAGADANISIKLQPKGTGQVVNNVGAVGTPSYTFAGDLTTGIYHDAANTISFSSAGNLTMDVGIAPGLVVIYGDQVAVSGQLQLGNQNRTQSVTLTVPTALANTQIYALPGAYPAVNGQVLTSDTAGFMSWGQAQKAEWLVEVATPVNMVANTYYLANDAAADVVFNMPALAAVGDMFWVVGMQAAHGWRIQMNAGQTALRIDGGAGNTTTVAGTITWNNGGPPTEFYSGVMLVCAVANTTFIQIGGSGNPLYA